MITREEGGGGRSRTSWRKSGWLLPLPYTDPCGMLGNACSVTHMAAVMGPLLTIIPPCPKVAIFWDEYIFFP